MTTKIKSKASIHWFRKGLRLHDNPAFLEACRNSEKIYPVFVIDPWFSKPDIVGINRYAFLLQSLLDLDNSLKQLGSRLFVAKGKPEELIPELIERWDITLLTFENDTEPYSIKRDTFIRSYCNNKVKVSAHATHTLHDPEAYKGYSGVNIPTTYQSFQKLFDNLGSVRKPIPKPTINEMPIKSSLDDYNENEFHIPTLIEMGYTESYKMTYPGGETEALRRMHQYVSSKPEYVCNFEKPNTSPNSILPSTTVLSPYIKFGCLSSSLFYHELTSIYKGKKHSSPPGIIIIIIITHINIFYYYYFKH
jgi:cryptochrome